MAKLPALRSAVCLHAGNPPSSITSEASMSNLQNLFALLGRILLALIFLQSGYGKIMNFDPTAAGMVKAGLPMVSVLLPITIFVELAGAVSLILGFKARWGAFGLLVFTLLAAYFFHNFWTMAD